MNVDRLTRQEIELTWREIVAAADYMSVTKADLQQVCDLALSALSHEAVRNEVLAALEEAARRYPDNAAVAFLFGAIGPTGTITAADLAALKREPNAAGRETDSEVTSISSDRVRTPAPAAPESETPETDALLLHGNLIINEEKFIAHTRSLERRLFLAQTEIKGHMRIVDDLKAELELVQRKNAVLETALRCGVGWDAAAQAIDALKKGP